MDKSNCRNRQLPIDISRREFLRRAASLGASVPLLGAAVAACGSNATSTTTSSASRKSRRGGELRVGLIGGSSADSLDANSEVGYPANARIAQLFDTLTILGDNSQFQYALAEEITSDPSATLWTIRLRPDVTFHNGRPLSADDVIYTFRRILNPKLPLAGATPLGPIDTKSLKKVDKLTLRVPMLTPYASFPDQLGDYYCLYIVPVDYDVKNPIGTGPFRYKSNTPGVQSLFTRNDSYWQEGLPYVDSVTIIDFGDVTSEVNALLSGSIDAAGLIDGVAAKALAHNSAVTLVNSPTGAITPFTMRVDVKPFDDVRVRQAMRLCIDRPSFVNLVFDGFAKVGNDVSSPYDPAYDTALRREQDIPQAKYLLKQAGHESVSVTLVTAPIAAGTVEAAQVLKEMASSAGININISVVDSGTFFGPDYLRWPFAQDFYYYSPYISQVAQELLPKSPFNETHWNNPLYVRLYNEVNRTLDPVKRRGLEQEMMRIDFNDGGLIIPSYNNVIDAYSSRLRGFVPCTTGYPLSNFALDKLWFA